MYDDMIKQEERDYYLENTRPYEEQTRAQALKRGEAGITGLGLENKLTQLRLRSYEKDRADVSTQGTASYLGDEEIRTVDELAAARARGDTEEVARLEKRLLFIRRERGKIFASEDILAGLGLGGGSPFARRTGMLEPREEQPFQSPGEARLSEREEVRKTGLRGDVDFVREEIMKMEPGARVQALSAISGAEDPVDMLGRVIKNAPSGLLRERQQDYGAYDWTDEWPYQAAEQMDKYKNVLNDPAALERLLDLLMKAQSEPGVMTPSFPPQSRYGNWRGLAE